MAQGIDGIAWQEVLAFWFPEGHSLRVDPGVHQDHWFWRMRGGADQVIVDRFSALTADAAAGGLDGWAESPEGRLALIIVLDQFSRSVWRGSARAFAQDAAALEWVTAGLANGHYTTLATPWQKIVYGLPLGHCEGPGHLGRLDLLIALREEIAAQAPAPLQPIYRALVKQAHDVRRVIAAFGRHPHRNELLGRVSTPAEHAYIKQGQFPHLRAFEP
ncbi:DUF924 family protein [Alcanivorax quisquiliarum]|uniref:DUF924 domain-containing protein n=1 Tax=Alcanivorax quisquiliarum TaxID=2933565 RepID=A0ABT0E5L7_9GAMM|nr:DUF924 domain-containing protein [Alcanivorax quisquiliarum]